MQRIARRATCLALATILALLATGPASAKKSRESGDEKLAKVAARVEERLNSIGSQLAAASDSLSKLDLRSDEAKEIIAEVCKDEKLFEDCAIIDADGTVVAIEPKKYARFEEANVGKQKHFVRMKKTLKPVVSDEFKAVEGFHAVEFGAPIISNNKFKGAVSTIVKPPKFLEGIIKPVLAWNATNVWVMQADGVIIYSRYAQAIGDNLAKDTTYVGAASFASLLKEVLTKESGSMSYRERAKGSADPRERKCRWLTVGFNGTKWRIILFGPARG